MTWARMDDRYDDNRKTRAAWYAHPRAVGLHAMAVTYCARNETDGEVDPLWLREKLPSDKERQRVLDVLVETGLFRIDEDGTVWVNDYLDYNPSRDDLQQRRRADAARKRNGAKAA